MIRYDGSAIVIRIPLNWVCRICAHKWESVGYRWRNEKYEEIVLCEHCLKEKV